MVSADHFTQGLSSEVIRQQNLPLNMHNLRNKW